MIERFEELSRWEDLADALRRLATLEQDMAARALLFEQEARLWSDRIKDQHRAIESWRLALECGQENMAVLMALADVYEKQGCWEEMLDVLRRAIVVGRRAGMAAEDLKPLLARVARTAGSSPDRTETVLEAWRALLELDPTDLDALNELDRLLVSASRWKEVMPVTAYEHHSESHPPLPVDASAGPLVRVAE